VSFRLGEDLIAPGQQELHELGALLWGDVAGSKRTAGASVSTRKAAKVLRIVRVCVVTLLTQNIKLALRPSIISFRRFKTIV
jgi:hypothetical protein